MCTPIVPPLTFESFASRNVFILLDHPDLIEDLVNAITSKLYTTVIGSQVGNKGVETRERRTMERNGAHLLNLGCGRF